ncbi:DISARM system SNF2-like helicase DrmD [Candidatus Poseidoniaceae archaeon]|nr:DISARM system SNF2-like helicase DrmD [Candidatus Poseidoniaceae archaeon]
MSISLDTSPPEVGQVVVVRGRPAVVTSVSPSAARDKVTIHSLEIDYVDDIDRPSEETIIWERERSKTKLGRLELPLVGEGNPVSPERYAAYLDSQHWMNAADLISAQSGGESPMTAAWRSAVQIEDYQLFVVQKALAMPRVRLLLADDVGLGKTVEAGLVLSELIVQRRIRRILIITPASLQTQWKEEMEEKFSLGFTVMDRKQQRNVERERGLEVNPWTQFPRIITSMHYLRQENELDRFMTACNEMEGGSSSDSPTQLAWDLLIVDEAHNLSPDRREGKDSQLCDMLRDVGPRAEHRLFLTATPHNGFTESFTGLLELLDPVRFQQKAALEDEDRRHIRLAVIRRMKKDIHNPDGSLRFKERNVKSIPFDLPLNGPELQLYDALRSYKLAVLDAEKRGKRSQAVVGFALALLTKRLLSSPYGFARTWYRHTAGLRSIDGTLELAERAQKDAESEIEDDNIRDDRELEAVRTAGAWLREHRESVSPSVIKIDTALESLGWTPEIVFDDDSITQSKSIDSKVNTLLTWIKEHLMNGSTWNGERVLIFTEYVDTLRYITSKFQQMGWKEPTIGILMGGSSEEERSLIKARFNDPTSETRILIATDAAAEGLNLQHTCRYLVHIEVPWNPMRLEQRNGRLDRHGQQREVTTHHFISPQAEETAMLDYVARKANTVREDLGKIGKILDESLMNKFTSQSSLEEWKKSTNQYIDGFSASQPKDDINMESLADKGGIVEQQEASAAHSSWSDYFGLNEESLMRLFEHGVKLSHGSLSRDDRDGFLRWNSVPPSWLPMVDSKMVLSKGAGRLKMCFDESRMKEEGQLRWRKDSVLLRLGHPAMTKASKRLQRLLWESRATTTNPFSRWSIEVSEEVQVPTFEVATLRIVRNNLREPILAELDITNHKFTGEKIESSGLRMKVGKKLEGSIPEETIQNIRSSWLHSSSPVEQAISEKTKSWINDLDERLKHALSSSLSGEKKAYDTRMKELKKSTERNEKSVSRIRDQIELWERRSLQLTLEGTRLPEAVAKTEEFKAKLVDEEFRRRKIHVDEQIERLEKEKSRVLDKVTPMRFSRRGEPQVWPLGVRVLLPKSEVIQ